TLDAYDNQNYPFDQLVDKLKIPRTLNRNPLFDVAFVTQNMDNRIGEAQSLKMSPYQSKSEKAHFDLKFIVVENNQKIQLTLEYSTSLFKKATAEKILDRYADILARCLENTHLPLKNIELTHDFEVAKSSLLKDDTDDFGF
ncbi:MAG: hypothetical protein GY757_01275, partial [bacterium]|nr:hypothetical protein [bacterium]